IAVAYAHTPYVAFTHDDSRWEPGALARAACLLDEHASVAVVSACVKEAESGRVHPQCAEVARRATLTDSSEGGRSSASCRTRVCCAPGPSMMPVAFGLPFSRMGRRACWRSTWPSEV